MRRNFPRWAIAVAILALLIPLTAWSQGAGGTASFKLIVPADAIINVNGKATKTPGTERVFTTTAIPDGKSFSYQVEVIWKDNGLERKTSIPLTLKAGDQISFDLVGKSTTQPKTMPKKAEPPVTDPKKLPTTEPKKIDLPKEEPKKVEAPKPEPKKVETPTLPPPVDPKKVEAPKPPPPPPPPPPPEPKKVEAPKEEPKKIEPPKVELKKVEEPKNTTSDPKLRSFQFTYAGRVKDVPEGKTVKVWLPVAATNLEQEAVIVSKKLPAPDQMAKEPTYGNQFLFFEAKAGKDGVVPFEVVYSIDRVEVKTDAAGKLAMKVNEDKTRLARYLQPDNLVPITGKPLELIKDKKLTGDQFASAKVLYDVVNGHMKYSKDQPGWGKGDAVWACDSKFGNCTDFHSLFISMARGNKIPSKFEMGFSVPPMRGEGPIGGYHCWAWFLPDGKGWIPVDISEANRNPSMQQYYFGNLTEDRVVFTTGRDFDLAPKQSQGPVNFLIYPYAEIDGAAVAPEKIEKVFSYKDRV